MVYTYKGQHLSGVDEAQIGRAMLKIDGLSVYRGIDHIIIIQDDKVIERFDRISMYEYYVNYARARMEYKDEEVRFEEC